MKFKKFFSSVGVLSLATISSQVINTLFIPVFSRFYPVEEFDKLAIVVSSTAILITISGLRFDLLIVKSEKFCQALILFVNSVLFSVFFCGLLYILGEYYIAEYLEKTKGLWGLISCITFFYNFYNNLYSLYIRQEDYRSLAVSRIIQAISSNSLQLFLAIYFIANYGLVYGYLSVFVAGGIYLLFKAKLFVCLLQIKGAELLQEFRGNLNSAKSAMVEGFFEVAGYQLPILIIALYSVDSSAAFLFMTLKILNIPLSVIAQPYSAVFYKQGVDAFKIGKYEPFFKKHFKRSIAIFTPALFVLTGILYLFLPNFLGYKWAATSELILYMFPVTLLSFISVIFCRTFYVKGQLKLLSNIQVVGFFIRVLPVSFGVILNMDSLVYIYIISCIVYYTCFIFYIYKSGDI